MRYNSTNLNYRGEESENNVVTGLKQDHERDSVGCGRIQSGKRPRTCSGSIGGWYTRNNNDGEWRWLKENYAQIDVKRKIILDYR